MNLVDKTNLSDDDFVLYTAKKVNLSDRTQVPDGTQVIVYTRIWNEKTLEYEYYAIDHDGKMFQCYESGDVIQWVGSQVPTAEWIFTEIDNSTATYTSYKYQLKNKYSNQYLAPRLSNGGQILSDQPFNLNMNGRRYGDAYTDFIAWDDPAYDYAGVEVVDGHIEQCHRIDTTDFYFAIVEPGEMPVLDTVTTADNHDYGITMKMQNYQYQGYYIGSGNGKYRQKDQADVLGLDTNTAGLLTTNLDQNGYPTAVASNRSLYELYDETVDVNHLFLQSIYDESGYLEYDCTQNFAHLKDTPNASGEYDFEVYNDLGTIGDTTDKPTRAHGQFMPYNQLGFYPNHIYSKTTNETDVLGNPLSDLDPRKGEKLYYINDNQPKNRDIIPGEADYFFGMQMDATFAQTPSGLDAWGHDIIFEFSGDDDFWLYVDGELVLDIGGVHSASVGKINFRTGAVEMIVRDANGNVLSSRTKNTTLKELFESNYRARGMSEDEIADKLASIFIEKQEDGHTYYVFKDDSIHTMKMFYMERGAGSSNLHMRFNLTAVKPGEVKLQKTVSGTDSRDYNNIKFPYQIEYFDQDDQEWRQLRNTDDDKPVTLEGTTEDIDYRETYEINGVEYDHVYLITPAQTALIDFFGDDNTIYRIRECGVDTDLYDTVKANDVELEGEATSVENQEDYKTEGSTVIDRKRVVFDNHVDENALRSLSFTKRLYKEDEITPLTYEQDQTLFNFVVYMGDESEDYDKLSPCYMAQYCILNPQGYYCMWSLEQQKFVSLNKTEYSALTPEEKSVATFTTSGGGEIEKIPAGYTVELHDCLVGTKYKIVESATDPGYKFMKYERDLNEDPDYKYYSTMPESEAANMGVIRVGENPRVYVDNKRGWGLTVKKVWSDARFMESHDPIYIGVYINDQLLDNTLRRIKHPATSLYYFFDNLEEGCDFEDYVVREVKIEGDPTVNANGYVTGGVTSVTPVDEGGSIDVHGVPKTGDPADFRYTVTYDVGTPTGSNDHVRTDTVNNTRNGVKLVKTDVSGEPLAGATFTLTDNEGHPAGDGSYTTGDDGLIAYAYLPDGEYILTETKIPTGYQPMARSFRLEVENNRIVSVEGADSHAYKLDNSGNMSILEVKNRLFSLKAIKVDQDGEPLENMHFALYRQVTTSSGIQRKDYYPINGFGYNDLISGHDGVIPKINEHLPPGTYYLEEKVPLPGDNYEERADLCFEITNNGEVLLKSGITGDKITEEEVKDDEGTVISINYTMKVRDNIRKHRVSIWKTDDNNVAITSGVSFKLYKKADYNDDTEQPNPGAVPVRTGTTNNKGILALDNLAIGEYRLVETSIPDGYEPMNGAVRITVGAELVTAMQDGNPCNTYVKGDAQWVSGQPNDTIQIQVYNHAGVELPESGGPGTTWIYMIGGFLTVACGVAIAARRRSKGTL
ncbi:MAG: hypothetical protein IIZ27_04460 [Solobacterium sp.]|nr:hypothetical protein [Solobacterium sp.]